VVVKAIEVKLLRDFYGVPDEVKEALVSLSKETTTVSRLPTTLLRSWRFGTARTGRAAH
jgi:hypothetical protein